MSVRTLLKVAEKYTVDNAPTLISALAVTGTLTTAFLTGRATFAAAEIIAIEQANRDLYELHDDVAMTRKEKIKLVWPQYIPPAIAVVSTITCIVTANQISASRIAGMAAAYKLTEDHFEEYREKVKEKLGLKDEEALVAEIDQDNVDETYSDAVSRLGMTPVVNGDVLFRDDWTGRYFYSSMARVKQVENQMNTMILKDSHATLSDFYEGLGLENTADSSEVGFSLENPLSLRFTTALAENGSVPVAVMHFGSRPHFIRDYGRMGS